MLKLLAKTAPSWSQAYRYLESIGFKHRGFITGPQSVDTHYAGWLPSGDGSVEWHVVMMERPLDNDLGNEPCVQLVYGSPCALPGEHPVHPHGVVLSPTMEQWVKAHCLSESEGNGIGPVLGFVSGSPVHPDRDDELLLGEGMIDPVCESLEAGIAALTELGTIAGDHHARVLQAILDQKHNGVALTDGINDAVFG